MSKQTVKEIIVTKVGLLAQWSDSGRSNSQLAGYSQSGAVDWFSYQLANALCGNPLDTPAIEVMGGLFSFCISGDCIISITGAKADLRVNNKEVALNQLLLLKAGDNVSISQLTAGMFNYVSFAAIFNLPLFKNSVCAVKREKIGGSKGDGTGIAVGECFGFTTTCSLYRSKSPRLFEKGGLNIPLVPLFHSIINQQYSSHKHLPIMFSYQHTSFSNIDKRRLLAHAFKVSIKLDKMGVRLDGPSLVSQALVLTSQPMCNGAVQIPGDGKPIVMRNDRQTIGGYPVIGVVNSLGLALLSQSCAHEKVSFRLTNIESSIISRRFIDIQLNRVLNEARRAITESK
jgi:allophanate hydrolase subunit 2